NIRKGLKNAHHKPDIGLTTFNYDQPDVPATVLAGVVAEMSSDGIAPESDEVREQRWLDNQAWLAEQRQRDLEHRLAHERQQADAVAVAEREAAILAAKEREEWRREHNERQQHLRRDRELADLRCKAAQHENWQRTLERSAVNSAWQQRTQTILGELEALINPPLRPPEPVTEIVYVSEDEWGSPHFGPDFNPKLWNKI